MIIGIPKEIKSNENRVSMLPFGVEELVKSGHKVVIQSSAGIGSGISDDMYINFGAEILSDAKQVYQKSDLIVKVKEPQKTEYSLIRKNS